MDFRVMGNKSNYMLTLFLINSVLCIWSGLGLYMYVENEIPEIKCTK